MLTILVKQGDLFPDVEATVLDENGAVVDITSATLTFSMRAARSPTTIKVSGAAGQLVNGPQGKVAYRWAGTDTDTPGTYEGEFVITPAVGDPFKFPTNGYITVVVEAKVA